MKGFIPFVMLGDPDLETSLRILQTLVDAGADGLEVGIPFSDPIADGPVIQRAALRAFSAGVKPGDCFDLIKKFRQSNATIPVGVLTYANLVTSRGIGRFYGQCQAVGVTSVLVADVPTIEAKPFVTVARNHQIQSILIAPPNIDDARLKLLAELCSGYTYVVTRPGVTGADERVVLQREIVDRLKQVGAPPAIFGFGISKPEHVRQAIEAGAAGAISGSAVVSIIERLQAEPDKMCQQLGAFVQEMRSALTTKS